MSPRYYGLKLPGFVVPFKVRTLAEQLCLLEFVHAIRLDAEFLMEELRCLGQFLDNLWTSALRLGVPSEMIEYGHNDFSAVTNAATYAWLYGAAAIALPFWHRRDWKCSS